MRVLIRTIETKNGELYYTKGGSRYKLTDCPVQINIYKDEKKLPAIGASNCVVKKYYVSFVICEPNEDMHEFTEEKLKSISGFLVQADILREDGIYERFTFDRISGYDFDMLYGWTFDNNDDALTKRLIGI